MDIQVERNVMAANNKHLLDTNEGLTPEDIAAVAERIIYIRDGQVISEETV